MYATIIIDEKTSLAGPKYNPEATFVKVSVSQKITMKNRKILIDWIFEIGDKLR